MHWPWVLNPNKMHLQWPTKNNKQLISPFKKAQGAKQPRQHGFYQIYFLVIWISAALFITFQDADAENILGNQLAAPPSSLTPSSPRIDQILTAWSNPPSPPAPRGIRGGCVQCSSIYSQHSAHYALISLHSSALQIVRFWRNFQWITLQLHS